MLDSKKGKLEYINVSNCGLSEKAMLYLGNALEGKENF